MIHLLNLDVYKQCHCSFIFKFKKNLSDKINNEFYLTFIEAKVYSPTAEFLIFKTVLGYMYKYSLFPVFNCF